MEAEMRYVIVGNGGAGLRAAQTLRKHDPQGEITVVDREPLPCYYRMRLPDYISGWRDRDSVFVVRDDFYAENGIRFLGGRTVVEVRAGEKTMLLESGEALPYDRLLLACGARPRKLDVPGSELDGVVYLRTLEQAEDIIRRGKEADSAVALGGGLLGVEMARAFNEMGLRTRYLIREDRFWPQMLDAEGSRLVERVLESKGIELLKEEGIEEVIGEEGRMKAVRTTSGRELPAGLLGVAIGVVSNLEFLEGSGLETDRGILVDDRLRSNLPDIYAAGDAAQALDRSSGEHRIVTSWLNAQRQGEIAAVNMSGGEAVLEGVVPYNVIVIYGLPVACIGLDLPPENEEYEVLTGDYPRDGKYRKLVLREGILVGATFIGEIGEARAAEELIRRGVDLSAWRDRLFLPGFDLRQLAKDANNP
ncbi:FAD-dependent oxidoreductase [Candidatus Solincola tengchongensis]|uniref:NAD(P)/FAD-dependent oxidoreductase n=1 Tax=Candidatus Solincola tengchongensis TaxID=2900693 RepID=UPI00257A3F9C|nr:FAD-dependent oxidoreductase [Candidatus Solincola tengchongensis]